MIINREIYKKIKNDKPNQEFLNECEWDIIREICQNAIKRKGCTIEQVKENCDRILKEVRVEINLEKSSKETIDNQ